MTQSSRRYRSDYQLTVILDDICKGLEELVGDITREIHFPSDPADVVDCLVLLGKACMLAHTISNRRQSPSHELLNGLQRVANVMGAFERDLTRQSADDAVEVMLHMLEESACAIDGHTSYFEEYLDRYESGPSIPILEMQQALSIRRQVEFARVALEEMGMADDVPDLLTRIHRFDRYYSRVLAPFPVGLSPIPGIEPGRHEWWVRIR